ncbi:MAG: hypothetical protein MUF18_17355 [Fimbriiglobus sp.]|nr:hypothetical protein [Fimbriiglobus sp.]
MPTLKQPTAPVDTAAPGLTRRRVWQAPVVRSHGVVTLTFARLYLAPAAAVRPDTIQAIHDGADLDRVFGPLATVVDLPTVRRVTLDLETNTLTLDYRPTLATGSGSIPTGQVVIQFDTYEAADEVFTKIWRRIADRMKLHQDRASTADRLRGPLAAIVGVLVCTITLAVVTAVWGDAGHPAAGRFAPDWRWVCGLGGAVLAGLQVWLYRRWTTPPRKLELRPAS